MDQIQPPEFGQQQTKVGRHCRHRISRLSCSIPALEWSLRSIIAPMWVDRCRCH